MADLQYIHKNRLRVERAAGKRAIRKKILAVGVLSALVLTVFYPAGSLLCLGAIAVAFLFTLGVDPIIESGANGEDYTLSILKGLPAEYIIFNQLEIPDEKSRTGFRELDFVVCGPKGIFVVESKNHNGKIEGHENDHKWTIHKVGRGGTAYSDTIRNPVSQTKQQVHVLKNYLKKKGVYEWVNGLVALSSNNDLTWITSPSIPVVKSGDVVSFILSHERRSGGWNLNKAIAALTEIVRSTETDRMEIAA